MQVWVEFEIRLRTGEYSYQGVEVSESLTISLPMESFSELDAGNLFKILSLNLDGKLEKALAEQADYDDKQAQKEKQ